MPGGYWKTNIGFLWVIYDGSHLIILNTCGFIPIHKGLYIVQLVHMAKSKKSFDSRIVLLALGVFVIGIAAYYFSVQDDVAEVTSIVQAEDSRAPKGTFTFVEFGTGGSSSANTWSYIVRFGLDNVVTLSVDGLQTKIRAKAIRKAVGDSYDVVFDSYESDSMNTGFKKGDVLMSLTPIQDSSGLSVVWKKMQPNLKANVAGSVFEKKI
jgi:hypothetical protein